MRGAKTAYKDSAPDGARQTPDAAFKRSVLKFRLRSPEQQIVWVQ